MLLLYYQDIPSLSSSMINKLRLIKQSELHVSIEVQSVINNERCCLRLTALSSSWLKFNHYTPVTWEKFLCSTILFLWKDALRSVQGFWGAGEDGLTQLTAILYTHTHTDTHFTLHKVLASLPLNSGWKPLKYSPVMTPVSTPCNTNTHKILVRSHSHVTGPYSSEYHCSHLDALILIN